MKPSQTEAEFTRMVLALARLRRWRTAHFRPARVLGSQGIGWRTPVQGDGAGFPDLILCRGPRLLAVELKTDTGRVSGDQFLWLQSLEAAGVETYVWRPASWPEIEQVLQ